MFSAFGSFQICENSAGRGLEYYPIVVQKSRKLSHRPATLIGVWNVQSGSFSKGIYTHRATIYEISSIVFGEPLTENDSGLFNNCQAIFQPQGVTTFCFISCFGMCFARSITRRKIMKCYPSFNARKRHVIVCCYFITTFSCLSELDQIVARRDSYLSFASHL